MVKDPEFLADAEKAQMFLRPMNGVEVEKIVQNVLAIPQPAIDRLTVLMSTGGEVQCSEYTNNHLCKSGKSEGQTGAIAK
jgi:hypothetical protein